MTRRWAPAERWRHAQCGDEVHIAFLTDGVGARNDDRAAAARRAAAAKQAARVLGALEPHFLDFPDNRLDTVALLDIIRAVETVVRSTAPHTIYTHHAGDLNIDHVICHRAVMTACRPLSGTSVRRIFAMEVASSTEWAPQGAGVFVPTRFVDIAATRAVKQRALASYEEEMRPFPHPARPNTSRRWSTRAAPRRVCPAPRPSWCCVISKLEQANKYHGE